MRAVNRVYRTGNGTIGFGAGSNKELNIDFISVCFLKEPMTIGEDFKQLPEDSVYDTTLITFENMESFKIFKKCVDLVEKNLTEKFGNQ